MIRVYGTLLAVLTVAVWVSLAFEDSTLVQRFGPNIATEILGIVVTLAVVHRILERQERARKMRAALGALRRSRSGLSAMLDAWLTLMKGAMDPRRTELPRRIHQVFEPYYLEDLGALDPAARPSAADPECLATAIRQLSDARETIRQVLVSYPTVLDPDYVEALEELSDDPFVLFVLGFAGREPPPQEEWRSRIRWSRGHMEAHFGRLLYTVELHNRLSQEAALFRSSRLAPTAAAMNIRVGPDRDLTVQTELADQWWSDPPLLGALR